MKRLFLLTIVAISSLSVFAQTKAGTFSVIPKLGVSLSNMTDMNIYSSITDDESKKSKYNAGFTAGVDLQYQATDLLAVSLGALYTCEGFRYSDFTTTNTLKGNIKEVYINENNHLAIDYLNVPLMAHVYVADNFSLNAGVQFGFLLGASYKYAVTQYYQAEDGTINYLKDNEGNELNGRSYNSDWKDYLKNSNVSIPVGISYEYSNVILDARYNIPLTKNGKYTDTVGELKNKTFLFTVGYRFDL